MKIPNPFRRNLVIWFYNLDNNRVPHSVVYMEVEKILESRPTPALLIGCEANAYDFPKYPGFRQIKDKSKPGRANITAWVNDKYPVRQVKWTDAHETWHNTDGPGEHWSRSTLSFYFAKVLAVGHHQPPKRTNNWEQAQREGRRILLALLKPLTEVAKAEPRIAAMDGNDPGKRSTLDVVAKAVRGRLVSTRLDTAIVRGPVKVVSVTYPKQVGGVQLKSDHGDAFRMVVSVPKKWLK